MNFNTFFVNSLGIIPVMSLHRFDFYYIPKIKFLFSNFQHSRLAGNYLQNLLLPFQYRNQNGSIQILRNLPLKRYSGH